MTTDLNKHIALREAECISALDAYFKPRPVEDGAMSRRAFEAGFERGFDAGGRAYAAAPSSPCAPAEPAAQGGERGCITVHMTYEQVKSLYLTLSHGRHGGRERPETRPAFGWMEQPLVEIEQALEPIHNALHDRQFNSLNRQFFGDDRFRFDEAPLTQVVSATPAPASPCASPAAAAVAGEPVAWRRWQAFDDNTSGWVYYEQKVYDDAQQLYAAPHPSPSAAEQAGRWVPLNSDKLWDLAKAECRAVECGHQRFGDGMHFPDRAALLRFAALVIDLTDAERGLAAPSASPAEAPAEQVNVEKLTADGEYWPNPMPTDLTTSCRVIVRMSENEAPHGASDGWWDGYRECAGDVRSALFRAAQYAAHPQPVAPAGQAAAGVQGEAVAWSPRLDYPNYEEQRCWGNGYPSPADIDYWQKNGSGVDLAYLHPAPACGLSEEQERAEFEAWSIREKWAYRDDDGQLVWTFAERFTRPAAWSGWQGRSRLTHPDATKETK